MSMEPISCYGLRREMNMKRPLGQDMGCSNPQLCNLEQSMLLLISMNKLTIPWGKLWMISVTGGVGRRWCGCCKTELEVRIERTRIKISFSKSYYCLLYKRTSKERRKGNPPTPSTLSLYTIRLPPSNHSSCSDVPSESYPMILHTTPSFLIITTTPPLLTSQHFRPLLYLTKLYRHHLAASSASSNVSAFP